LKIKTNEWRKEGRSVIDINLKGVPASFSDFKVSFAKAIYDAKLPVTGEEMNDLLRIHKEKLLSQLKKSVKELGTSAAKEVRPQNTFRAVWGLIQSYMGIPSLPINMLNKLGKVATHLAEWAKGTRAPEKVDDIIFLFQLLELHATKNPENPPVVIWREIQNIEEIRNAPYENWSQELYQRLFLHFEPRKEGTSLVPVIFESSDLLWSNAQNNYARESFSPYLLKNFTYDAAKSLLTLREKINEFEDPVFTVAEFEKVWNYSHGHQGTVYFLHNMLREGRELDEALVEMKTQDFARLRGIIHEGSRSSLTDFQQIVNERKHYLLRLQKANYSLPIEDINSSPVLLHFVQKNILFTDGKIACPQNMPIQHSIDDYLKLFVHDKL